MTSASGKYGVLEMYFERDSAGRSVLRHLHREVPMIVQQALYFDEQLPHLPCVYILSSGGPHLEGDRYRVEITLGEGAMAHISTGAATIIAPMDEDKAELHQSITLGEGAYLEWLPKPLIPAARSRYTAHTEFVIAPSATLFFSEVVACGRKHSGERFDYEELSLGEVVRRPDGEVLSRGGVRIIPRRLSPKKWAFLGDFSHFGSIVVVTTPEAVAKLSPILTPRVGRNFRMSVARLRDNSGFALRLAGNSSERLLAESRKICSEVRKCIKGVPLQEEFPWR